MNWLKDNCRWYRRWKGGRWARWNGFWERERPGQFLFYKRGFRGIDLAEGAEVWDFHQVLAWDDKYISAREDYTNIAAKESV